MDVSSREEQVSTMVCQVVSFMETMVSLDYVKMFARVAHEGQVRKYTGEPYVDTCGRLVSCTSLGLRRWNAMHSTPRFCTTL